MTRSEAIAIIEQSLSSDEATLNAAAERFQVARAEPSVLPRTPTLGETALIEQSKGDFKAGRTHTVTEARAHIDEALARRRSAACPKHRFEIGAKRRPTARPPPQQS